MPKRKEPFMKIHFYLDEKEGVYSETQFWKELFEPTDDGEHANLKVDPLVLKCLCYEMEDFKYLFLQILHCLNEKEKG